jgi:hypothetical protein
VAEAADLLEERNEAAIYEKPVMLKSLVSNFLAAWKCPRWRWALLTAAASDALGFGVVLWPPLQWLLDAVTAVVLFAMVGFRWPLLPALAVEVVPGLQLFPAWTLVVAALAGTENRKSSNPVGALELDVPSNQKPQ